ncbi:MAG: RNA polymerase sigma factor [Actinomycetota bacterium]|nr:RNA polymerase sigma factor [Actinomycetota bacterium]
MAIDKAFDEILEVARSGGEWAMETLYRDLAPAVLGYLRAQGAVDPEDATSEVFVGMVRNLHGFDGDEEAFRSWVFSIAHRRLLDQYRWRARRQEDATDPAAFAGPLGARLTGDVEDDALERIGSRRAVEALLVLPPDQRAVLLLRIVADLPVARVAQVLGKSKAAVKSLQARGLRALARKIQPEGVS